MSGSDGSDSDAFARAMKDVRPIKDRDKVKPRGSVQPRPIAKPRKPAAQPNRTAPATAPAPDAAPHAALTALQEAHEALRREADALQANLVRLEADRDALRAERDALSTERDALRAERDLLNEIRALDRTAAMAAPPPTPTPRPLVDAGLSDGQLVRTLEALVQSEPSRVARLLLVEGEAPHFKALDDRVVLACAACTPRLPRGVVPVSDLPPEACDLCGGSATQRAFEDLVVACAAANVRRILVLGGSPAYREAAQRLVKGAKSPLSFAFVGEGAKPGKKRANASASTVDLVVVWCGTMLDHTTTAAHADVAAPRVTVSKRGIGSMFTQVADFLLERTARGR